jgi:polygalacturonase
MKRIPALAIAALAFALPAPAAALAPSDSLPAWVKEVGARTVPTATRVFSANSFGAVADTLHASTAAIQRAIDAAAAAGGGVVSFQPGGYVTGAIFLKSGVTLKVDEGVTLFGSQNDADYPRRPTRIAGIEMTWPTALINVDGQKNVRITGRGTIDGRGKKWWDKYWSMRREVYEPRGLRWAVDYDAERVRLMVVTNSSDISIENLNLRRSGFWTVQLLYSDHVTVDGVKIGDNEGPSTDGVDIDSSRWILVQNTEISNNDDTICLKAGRDADGLRVNRPTEYVVVRDNYATRGAGIFTIGSETSGSIRHVVAIHNRAKGTKNGIIFKSAKTRGGTVEDVLIRDVVLDSVPTAFAFSLNWNPSYSYATLPDSIKDVPPHWKTLLTPVTPPERGYAEFRDITIEDVVVNGSRRLISAEGLPEKPIHDVHFRNVTAQGADAGSIRYARDWSMENVVFRTPSGEQVKVTDSERVELPVVKVGGTR